MVLYFMLEWHLNFIANVKLVHSVHWLSIEKVVSPIIISAFLLTFNEIWPIAIRLNNGHKKKLTLWLTVVVNYLFPFVRGKCVVVLLCIFSLSRFCSTIYHLERRSALHRAFCFIQRVCFIFNPHSFALSQIFLWQQLESFLLVR